MALNITTTYSGDATREFILKAFFNNNAISGNYVTILTDIKDKRAVQKLTSGDILQGDSCSFDASGDLSVDESILDPSDIKVNTQACASDLESHWNAARLRPGANNSDLSSIQDYIVDLYTQKVGETLDTWMWQGDPTGTPAVGEFDGFEKVLEDAAGTNDVTGTTLTATNIIDEVGKVYDEIPAQLVNSPDMKIFVSHSAAKLYRRALASTSGDANFAVYGDKPLDYLGIEVVPVGLAADVMIAAETTNLFMGTDLVSDFGEIRIIDMRETDGSDYIRYKMRMKAGVQVGFAAETVLYN